ncbi:MAG: hypothetical protein N4A74_00445 [Carboxylicivirga sp.]|jgi:hypothetical protein|nr:hypothetical protein [Carboxylicivirga sp.]
MNYIRHLNHVLEHFAEDQRIIPRHISMYMALFFLWNKFKFPEFIYINRNELMPLSKIGSMKYYHLTLNELNEWNYVQYQPSRSAYKSSCVKILTCFNSDTSSETSGRTTTTCSTETGGEASTETCSATTSEAININTNKPVINNKETVETKGERVSNAPSQIVQDEVFKSNDKKEDTPNRFQKPTLEALENYFASKEAPGTEAERFFNHFESNGWKVGGKSPMKDWKAAVRNWILNMNKYRSKTAEHDGNPLSTTNDKDYGEPL